MNTGHEGNSESADLDTAHSSSHDPHTRQGLEAAAGTPPTVTGGRRWGGVAPGCTVENGDWGGIWRVGRISRYEV